MSIAYLKALGFFFNLKYQNWAYRVTGTDGDHEQNGKNYLFERPILILKKFNKRLVLGIFLTSKYKDNVFNFSLDSKKGKNAIISQIKTLSTKRLTRKIMRLGNKKFVRLLRYIRKNLFTKIIQLMG